MAVSRDASRVGKRGTFVIPARLRRRFGIDEGSFLVAEEAPQGILLRPASVAPVAVYTREERAQYLLSNVGDAKDYAAARKEVQKMGLDPNKIKHHKPR